ncbi:unnamed protein product, partial [Chrysoparadoxa australica]
RKTSSFDCSLVSQGLESAQLLVRETGSEISTGGKKGVLILQPPGGNANMQLPLALLGAGLAIAPALAGPPTRAPVGEWSEEETVAYITELGGASGGFG